MGDQGRAAALYEETLALQRELGNNARIANALDGFACVAAVQGRMERAFRLAGAAAGLREVINAELSPTEQAVLDRCFERARREVDPAQAAQAFDEGRAMTLERALEYALEAFNHEDTKEPRRPRGSKEFPL